MALMLVPVFFIYGKYTRQRCADLKILSPRQSANFQQKSALLAKLRPQ